MQHIYTFDREFIISTLFDEIQYGNFSLQRYILYKIVIILLKIYFYHLSKLKTFYV